MKTILCLCITILTGFSGVYAQKAVPAIKQGTNMFATVVAQGQEIPVWLTVEKTDNTVSLKWFVENYGEGAFEMSMTAFEGGNALFAGQPGMGVTKLGDKETFGLISKAAFKTLSDTKSFSYNGEKFILKENTPAIKLGDKELDTYHVATEDGRIQLWILNNPEFPLLIQTSGLSMDMIVGEIK